MQAPRSSCIAAVTRLVGESIIWAVMMSGTALFALMSQQARVLDPQVVTILTVYFAGGAVGYLMAFPATYWFGRRIASWLTMPLAAIALTCFTLGATAGFLALDYRTYYAQWHESAFSIGWFFQLFFTTLSSTYQYLVIGTRLYWPLGPLFLFLASWWVTRRAS